MIEYLMYIFEDQICMFGDLIPPDKIVSLVFSTKIGLLIDSTQLNTTIIQTGS